MSDRLNPGDSLAVGGSIPSLDGGFTLTLQADGNLVLYHIGGAPVGWATGTVGRAVTQAIMPLTDTEFDANGNPTRRFAITPREFADLILRVNWSRGLIERPYEEFKRPVKT